MSRRSSEETGEPPKSVCTAMRWIEPGTLFMEDGKGPMESGVRFALHHTPDDPSQGYAYVPVPSVTKQTVFIAIVHEPEE